MSYLDKVTVGSTTYDIQDTKAQGNIGDLQSALGSVSYIPVDICYVTNGIDVSYKSLAIAKIGKNVLSMSGTSSGLGYLNFFNGGNTYSSTSTTTPAKNLSAGTYTVFFTGTAKNKLDVVLTTGTYADRVELTNGQKITVGENGACIFARFYGSVDYGTSQNPTVLTLSIYEGEVTSTDPTAIDIVARNMFPNYAASPYYRNIDTHKADCAVWYESNLTHTEGFNENTTYETLIAAYDALAVNSGGYLTKTELGTANGYSVYEYVFAPKKYHQATAERKTPVILMCCAQHGFEKNASYAPYYFLRDIIENWDSNASLACMMKDVELRIIPSANPWGFDNKDRRNINGVNLNRNFDVPNWEGGSSGDSDYGGTEPFSEDETQIVRDWVLAHKSDALCLLDVHTNGQYNADGYAEANVLIMAGGTNDIYYNRIGQVFRDIINSQSIHLPNEITAFAGIPRASYIGKILTNDVSETAGKLNMWATNQGVIGITYELFNGLTDGDETTIITKFTDDSFKATTEILGNGILRILSEYGV